MKLRALLPLPLLLMWGAPSAAGGQAAGVSVSGRVQDAQTRAPLALLTVQLRRGVDSTFVGGRPTNSGVFTFAGLRKGTYVLEARSMGIPLAVQLRAFERFVRADAARSRMDPARRNTPLLVSRANGLGLAIARWIMRTHGGTLVQTNVPHQGSEFTATLPAGDDELPADFPPGPRAAIDRESSCTDRS